VLQVKERATIGRRRRVRLIVARRNDFRAYQSRRIAGSGGEVRPDIGGGRFGGRLCPADERGQNRHGTCMHTSLSSKEARSIARARSGRFQFLSLSSAYAPDKRTAFHRRSRETPQRNARDSRSPAPAPGRSGPVRGAALPV